MSPPGASETGGSTSPPVNPPGGQSTLVTGTFLRVTFANFGYFLSIGALVPVLPRFIEGPLGAGKLAVGVGVGAFTATALILRPFSGRLGDRRGRRLPIIAGLVIHTVSLVLLLAADSLALVVAIRLVTGVGEALFFVGASAAIQDLAPDHRRAEAASLFSLSLFGGLAIGPVVSEVILERFGFDAVWIFAATVSAAGCLIALSVPDTRTDKGPSAGSGRLIHGAALKPGLILACMVWGLAAFNTYVPLHALDLGLGGSRYVFLTSSLVLLLLRSVGAQVPDRVGPLRAARTFLVCTPLGMLLMALWSAPAALFVGAALQSTGQAMAFPSLMSIAVNNAPASERGAVVGTFTAFFDLAFGGGSIALGSVASAVGYSGGFMAAAAVTGVGFLILLISPPRPRQLEDRLTPVVEIEPPAE